MVMLENIMNNLQTMGPVFWAGAGAIALGATLLVVSILTMLRRVKFSRVSLSNPFEKKRFQNISSKSAQKNPAPSATARKTESGYEPTTFPLQSKDFTAFENSNQVPFELTDRLHRAADTLEEIIRGLSKENHSNGFSPLKDEAEGVEYLFKTTVG